MAKGKVYLVGAGPGVLVAVGVGVLVGVGVTVGVAVGCARNGTDWQAREKNASARPMTSIGLRFIIGTP